MTAEDWMGSGTFGSDAIASGAMTAGRGVVRASWVATAPTAMPITKNRIVRLVRSCGRRQRLLSATSAIRARAGAGPPDTSLPGIGTAPGMGTATGTGGAAAYGFAGERIPSATDGVAA